MKPFNLKKAKAGRPVCTRDGRKARIIAFDLKGDYPIVCAVTNPNNEQEGILLYSEDGMSNHVSSDFDLMMALVKHVGWVKCVSWRIWSFPWQRDMVIEG